MYKYNSSKNLKDRMKYFPSSVLFTFYVSGRHKKKISWSLAVTTSEEQQYMTYYTIHYLTKRQNGKAMCGVHPII